MFDELFIEKLASAVAKQITVQTAPKRLFTLAEAGEYMGRSARAIEMMVARGTIPVTKLDGKRQVDRIALDKLISDRTYFEA
jgi:excisionase family DNA binding protein